MEKNYAKKQKGITLVALVVTIVVLLILAGVSLNMVLGENGIVVKAKESLVKSDNANVSDSLKMLVASYIADDQGRGEVDTIEKLKEAGIIDNNNIVNVSALIERKLGTGNGSGKNDVYVIEDNTLYYYNKNEEQTDLGEIDNNEKQNDKSYKFSISADETVYLENRYSYYDYPNREIPEETVVIPSRINGIKVTKIGVEMFEGIRVKNVVLPEGITKIGDGAFKNTGLKSINIPNTVTEIGFASFYGCDITQIDIPSGVTKIDFYTFHNCNKLTTVNIPEDSKIESIEQDAFSGCSSLVELNIPKTVKEIGSRVFNGCNNIHITVATGSSLNA